MGELKTTRPAPDPERIDVVLAALANRHRREIVSALALHPLATHRLAQMRGLSLPAMHKHVEVLVQAGLVVRRKAGRTTYLVLDGRPLRLVQEWVGVFRTEWSVPDATFENYLPYLTADPPQEQP